jgi:hypothetical protein
MPFEPDDRRLLELAAGVGPTVVMRLEEVGLESLKALKRAGVDQVIERICQHTGSKEWRNRRRALLRAVVLADHRLPVR